MSSAIPDPMAPGPTNMVRLAAEPASMTETKRNMIQAWPMPPLRRACYVISHLNITSLSTIRSIMKATKPMETPMIPNTSHW